MTAARNGRVLPSRANHQLRHRRNARCAAARASGNEGATDANPILEIEIYPRTLIRRHRCCASRRAAARAAGNKGVTDADPFLEIETSPHVSLLKGSPEAGWQQREPPMPTPMWVFEQLRVHSQAGLQDAKSKERTAQKTNSVLQEIYGAPFSAHVEVFGSSSCELAARGSDLDMTFSRVC